MSIWLKYKNETLPTTDAYESKKASLKSRFSLPSFLLGIGIWTQEGRPAGKHLYPSPSYQCHDHIFKFYHFFFKELKEE